MKRFALALCVFLVTGLTVGVGFDLSHGGQWGGGFGTDTQAKVSVSAAIAEVQPVGPVLFVRAEVAPGWHIYSMTQGSGGPIPTKVTLKLPQGVRQATGFVASPPPQRKTDAAFPDMVVEIHEGTVVFATQLEIDAGVAKESLVVAGNLLAQPCDANACLPPRPVPFEAKWASQPPISQKTLAELVALLQSPGKDGSAQVAQQSSGQPGPPAVRTSPSATPGAAAAAGSVPATAPGRTSGEAGDGLPWRPFSLELFRQLVGPSFDPQRLKIQTMVQGNPGWVLLAYVAMGFLGGIVLNVMPCVLPVIGLKLLAFIQQAGESRWRAFWLNVWYSLGLLSIFALLALLAVTLQFGWGHLFRLPAFNVAMAILVFAMALAFLGVWTMPIPGFAGSGKAVELTQKEGVAGAFFKGVFTTILATPCTGPFMGSALAWSFTQPPAVVFIVFMSIGLGMAFPYLLVGAFPQLIRFLPKPGAWMETFERIMGFVLLGTVVFIFTFLDWPYIVPTIGLLFALWAACWWVERAGLSGSRLLKLRAWGEAGAFMLLVWLVLFPGIQVGKIQMRGLLGVMKSRFEERAQQVAMQRTGDPILLVSAQQPQPNGIPPGDYTVVVDCTANWCLTCKALEATVLNTQTVKSAFREKQVILLKADWTHESPEVTQFLDWLGFRQVPVLAIFPAGRPNEPIVFMGGYTQQEILRALEKAGPSRVSRLSTASSR